MKFGRASKHLTLVRDKDPKSYINQIIIHENQAVTVDSYRYSNRGGHTFVGIIAKDVNGANKPKAKILLNLEQVKQGLLEHHINSSSHFAFQNCDSHYIQVFPDNSKFIVIRLTWEANSITGAPSVQTDEILVNIFEDDPITFGQYALDNGLLHLPEGKPLVKYLISEHRIIYEHQLLEKAAVREACKSKIVKYLLITTVHRCGCPTFELCQMDAAGRLHYGLHEYIKDQIIAQAGTILETPVKFAGFVSKLGKDGFPLTVPNGSGEPWEIISATPLTCDISKDEMKQVSANICNLVTALLHASGVHLQCESGFKEYHSKRHMPVISQTMPMNDCVMLVKQKLSYAQLCFLVHEKKDLSTYFLDIVNGCQALTAAIPMVPNPFSPMHIPQPVPLPFSVLEQSHIPLSVLTSTASPPVSELEEQSKFSATANSPIQPLTPKS